MTKKTSTKVAKKTTKPVTKKVTTKRTSKKRAVKKVTTKKTNRAPLTFAADEHRFWMSDGQILATLVDLHQALAKVDEATFKHHVTKDKNDFADWVQHVLIDTTCATALRKAKKPATATRVVATQLKRYET